MLILDFHYITVSRLRRALLGDVSRRNCSFENFLLNRSWFKVVARLFAATKVKGAEGGGSRGFVVRFSFVSGNSPFGSLRVYFWDRLAAWGSSGAPAFFAGATQASGLWLVSVNSVWFGGFEIVASAERTIPGACLAVSFRRRCLGAGRRIWILGSVDSIYDLASYVKL